MSPPRTYIAFLLAGVILLLIGGIVLNSTGFIDDPDQGTSESREEYSDTVRTYATIGSIIEYIGLMVLSIGLIIGAIKDDGLHANVRLGMLIAMGLIIGFKIATLSPWILI
jgi:hypothetical protein